MTLHTQNNNKDTDISVKYILSPHFRYRISPQQTSWPTNSSSFETLKRHSSAQKVTKRAAKCQPVEPYFCSPQTCCSTLSATIQKKLLVRWTAPHHSGPQVYLEFLKAAIYKSLFNGLIRDILHLIQATLSFWSRIEHMITAWTKHVW